VATPPGKSPFGQPAEPPPGKPPEGRLPSLLPFIVMAVILLLIYAGVMLFPVFNRMMKQQDCIASGRTDCVARPAIGG